ncbi:MAG: sulfatase [Planctomycetaceae bacterium]|nr:sulfatase [Planctomycetaceae bacterium]
MVFCCLFPAVADEPSPGERPNVLFIAVDDLNHWVGHLKRNPQTITPNVDRLAAMGVSFSRAYCAAPACNPSRTTLMSGIRPSTTGIYHNDNDYRPHIRPEQTLNSWFRANGYYVCGAGKIYHGGGGRVQEWDEFTRPGQVNNQGQWSSNDIGGIRWSVLKGDDDAVADYFTVSYCIDQLQKTHDKPLFLACGIFRPHMPWSVPKKYYDMHPLEEIQLPPYREDDLSDVPKVGVTVAKPEGDHKHITDAGKWKEAVQAYLASITYADAQLGRLLDALEQSAFKDNTIIVLWGDHGWHLGEKQHWRKFALWEEATRAPLIWVAPGVTPQNRISPRTVDFTSIYPTLCELAGLETPSHLEGVSIASLLRDPEANWDRPALTTHGFQRHAVRSERWRYIRYDDGSEELYDHDTDPYEWTNVASRSEYASVKAELARWMPSVNNPEVEKEKSGNAKAGAGKAAKSRRGSDDDR